MADEPTSVDKGCYTEHGVSGYGVAVKLTRPAPMDASWIKEMAEEMMLTIAGKCLERGAKYIGHIKSHIKTSAGTLKADTIGVSHGAYSAGDLDHPVTELYMAVNSIVQGVNSEQVKAATLDGIHQIAERKSLAVVKEKEHAYFDQFDFIIPDEEHERRLKEQIGAVQPTDPTGSGDEIGDDPGHARER